MCAVQEGERERKLTTSEAGKHQKGIPRLTYISGIYSKGEGRFRPRAKKRKPRFFAWINKGGLTAPLPLRPGQESTLGARSCTVDYFRPRIRRKQFLEVHITYLVIVRYTHIQCTTHTYTHSTQRSQARSQQHGTNNPRVFVRGW